VKELREVHPGANAPFGEAALSVPTPSFVPRASGDTGRRSPLRRDRRGTWFRSRRTCVVGFFAVLALSLATAGLYGVLSFGVNQRRRGIGIRAALGATPGDLVVMVLLLPAGSACRGHRPGGGSGLGVVPAVLPPCEAGRG
jgi:hypothetical protein